MLAGAMSVNKHNPTMPETSYPLALAAPGEVVELTEMRAGARMQKRLGELGLSKGMRVRIVQGNLSGPVILAIRDDSRLAIGHGMAQKIMVKPLGEQR